jgi:hypothetical protein
MVLNLKEKHKEYHQLPKDQHRDQPKHLPTLSVKYNQQIPQESLSEVQTVQFDQTATTHVFHGFPRFQNERNRSLRNQRLDNSSTQILLLWTSEIAENATIEKNFIAGSCCSKMTPL